MDNTCIHKKTMDFLKALAKNNDRSWFNDSRNRYDVARENVASFSDHLLLGLKKRDLISTPSGKKSLYRINRDVRFSKDKSPYNLWFSGYFRRATDQLRGGYYFRIQPGGNSVVGGGFWGPNKEDLAHLRNQIASDAEPLRTALKDKKFKAVFSKMEGDKVKTHPRGFSSDHPEIDLIRHKQFLVMKSFTDQEVMHKDFSKEVTKGLYAMRPFLNAMSLYLTTDLNGEPLV